MTFLDRCSYNTSLDASCILQKSRRVMCSQPSENKMNTGRTVPAVSKHYIFLLCFRLMTSHVSFGSKSKGQDTRISHYYFKQKTIHRDWTSICRAPSEPSSYLTVISRIFRTANVWLSCSLLNCCHREEYEKVTVAWDGETIHSETQLYTSLYVLKCRSESTCVFIDLNKS